MTCEGLVDKRAYLMVIGCLLQSPTLLDDMDMPLDERDFDTEYFYMIVFSAINNLHFQGCVNIDELSIDSYLSNLKEQYAIFRENDGLSYLMDAREMAQLENYSYYYHRVRKYSLLRYLEKTRENIMSEIYNPSISDITEMEKEQNKFDNYTENDILDLIEVPMVINPRMKYCTNTLSTDVQAGSGMNDLVDELMEIPDVGLPLNNEGLNTISRGARLGCLFMRSCPAGGGKSRMAAGDACKFSVPYFWDLYTKSWVYTGISEPTLYITTEMTPDEIQTILIATVSKVNEEHILEGVYEKGELERVRQAIDYIKSAPLYIVHIPDFSITDIKNVIKKYNREWGVSYVVFDYIHTSLRLMSEVNSKSGMGLKEHQLLLVFATELKTIAQQINVFIFTASQLNGEAQNATYKDANLLAGSKALANKLDVGIISMKPTKAELKKIEPIVKKSVVIEEPNMAHWVYKVRRGKLTRIIVWSKVDLGTMIEKPLFVTTYDFELIDIDFTQIEQVEEKIREHSVPLSSLHEVVESQPIETIKTEAIKTERKEKTAFDLPFDEDFSTESENEEETKVVIEEEPKKKIAFDW